MAPCPCPACPARDEADSLRHQLAALRLAVRAGLAAGRRVVPLDAARLLGQELARTDHLLATTH